VNPQNTNEEKKKELVDFLARDDEISKTIEDLYQRRAVLVVRQTSRQILTFTCNKYVDSDGFFWFS